jgi:chromosome segregation ATPase
MCGKLFIAFVLALSFLLYAAVLYPAEQQYLISESQIQNIEKSLDRLETERRSWELQAAGLRSEAVSLNRQLAAEREQYRTLEESYNRCEANQSREMEKMKEYTVSLAAENKLLKKIVIGAGITLLLFIAAAFIVKFLVRG